MAIADLTAEGGKVLDSNLAGLTDEMVQTVAALSVRMIDDDAICTSMSLTIPQITAIRGLDSYVRYARDLSGAKVSKELNADNMWDDLEARSLSGMLTAYKDENLDIDLHSHLRVAQLANSAKRKLADRGGTIDAGNVNNGVTINLTIPSALVQHMQQRVIEHEELETGTQRTVMQEGAGDYGHSLENVRTAPEAGNVKSFEKFIDQKVTPNDVNEVLGVDVVAPKKQNRMDEQFASLFAGTGTEAE